LKFDFILILFHIIILLEYNNYLKHLIFSYLSKIKLNTCKNKSIQYISKQRVNPNGGYICRLFADFELMVNIFDFELIMKTTLLWDKNIILK